MRENPGFVDEITEYERARNLRAKALRDEVALTLIAAGHFDVVAVGENFRGAYTPPTSTQVLRKKGETSRRGKQSTLSAAYVRRSQRKVVLEKTKAVLGEDGRYK